MAQYVDSVIFDLGAVLIRWDPQHIVNTFTPDKTLAQLMLEQVFQHQDWLDLDAGLITEQEAAIKIAARANVSVASIHELFAVVKQSFTQIDKTVLLLEKMSAHGIKLYCLSNMSVESYQYLTATHSFFKHFDGLVISGYEKLIKPDINIFELIKNKFKLNAAHTLFIDDMPYNISAALECGLQAIEFTESDTCYQAIIDKVIPLSHNNKYILNR